MARTKANRILLFSALLSSPRCYFAVLLLCERSIELCNCILLYCRCCPCLRAKRRKKKSFSIELSDNQQSVVSAPLESFEKFSCSEQRIFQMTVWSLKSEVWTNNLSWMILSLAATQLYINELLYECLIKISNDSVLLLSKTGSRSVLHEINSI